jgi:dethiobiotin synthetase
MKKFFITATDTDMGKTYFSQLLLKQLANAGYSTVALKPLAAGAKNTPQGLRCDDAVLLQQAITEPLEYTQINPIVWEAPRWPRQIHDQQQRIVDVQRLVTLCQPVFEQNADYCLIEGAGGWMVPLNHHELYADFVKVLACAVIVVVGIRLGCLNHAILTIQQIQRMHIPILGWVANIIDPDLPFIEDNIATLTHWLEPPLLARVDWGQGALPDPGYFR